MVILHIAALDGDMSHGVTVAVPQHVLHQQPYAETALLNCGIPNCGLKTSYKMFQLKIGGISKLPKPFDRPDIAVFHGIYVPVFPFLAGYLRNAGIPYVIVPHCSLSHGAQSYKHMKKWIANKLWLGRFIKGAKGIQCLTPREALQTIVKGRVFIAGNGVETPLKIKTGPCSHSSVRFLYIGRLDIYQKGLDLLIQAFALLGDEFLWGHISLSIFGSGNQEPVRNLLYQNGIGHYVSLNGPVFGQEKENLMNSSDVFVLTSRFEGEPLAVLEALAHGLPCLLTRGTNLSSQVSGEQCGWATGSLPFQIAESVRMILHKKSELTKYSENAAEYARRAFSWNDAAKRAVREYDRIIREAGLPSAAGRSFDILQ